MSRVSDSIVVSAAPLRSAVVTDFSILCNVGQNTSEPVGREEAAILAKATFRVHADTCREQLRSSEAVIIRASQRCWTSRKWMCRPQVDLPGPSDPKHMPFGKRPRFAVFVDLIGILSLSYFNSSAISLRRCFADVSGPSVGMSFEGEGGN